MNKNDVIVLQIPGEPDGYFRVKDFRKNTALCTMLLADRWDDEMEPLSVNTRCINLGECKVSEDVIRKLVRCEMSVKDMHPLMKGRCLCCDENDVVVMRAEDVLQGMQTASENGMKDPVFLEYVQTLFEMINRTIRLPIKGENNRNESRFGIGEEQILRAVIEEIEGYAVVAEFDLSEEDTFFDEDELEDLMMDLQDYLDNLESDDEMKAYSEEQMQTYIMHFLNPKVLNIATEQEKKDLVRFIDILEDKSPAGMMIKADSMNGGNSLYDCDYEEAADLYEQIHDMVGDGNSVYKLAELQMRGLITDDGEPDTDRAFVNYSIAQQTGNLDAQMKLVDLYLAGVLTNNPINAVNYLLHNRFTEQMEQFMAGNRESRYPDFMFRFAQMQEILGLLPKSKILTFYQTAAFGVEARMNVTEYDQDEELLERINSCMLELRQSMDSDEVYVFDTLEDVLELSNVSKVNKTFKASRKKSGDYVCTITVEDFDEFGDDDTDHRFFLALPEYGFTGFTDRIKLTSVGKPDIHCPYRNTKQKTFDVDFYEFRDNELYDEEDDLVLSMNCKWKVMKPEEDDETFLMATLVGLDVDNEEFMCGSSGITPGTMVTVDESYSKKTYEVYSVFRRTSREMSKNPEHYSTIRKVR